MKRYGMAGAITGILLAIAFAAAHHGGMRFAFPPYGKQQVGVSQALPATVGQVGDFGAIGSTGKMPAPPTTKATGWKPVPLKTNNVPQVVPDGSGFAVLNSLNLRLAQQAWVGDLVIPDEMAWISRWQLPFDCS